MRILITGIHGFVGSNLVAAYKNHHTLYGLDIVSPPKEGIEATYAWDEWEKIPAVDTIIHLAGKAHDTKKTADAQSYFDVNLGLTQKIFDYFLQSDAEKFIFFSSVKAVADTVPNDVLTENDTPNPQTPYGQSKLAAEQYILSQPSSSLEIFRDRPSTSRPSVLRPSDLQTFRPLDLQTFRPSDLQTSDLRPSDLRPSTPNKKIYILRPAMIHGPGNKGNLNLLYNVVKKGIPWPLGAFSNQRSILSIDNLSFIIRQLIEQDIQAGIYQLADDEPVSTNDIIRMISKSLNKKSKIIHLPQNLLIAMAKMGDLLHLPLNSERLKKLTESYVVSNQKIKQALGVENLPVDAKAGLLKTFDSFKETT